MKVTLIDACTSDARVVQAAKVSTIGADSYNTAANAGLIRYLMNNQHMSPFEHGMFTFLVEAPIFVTRELLRHRTSSFNEESGRYRELAERFYYPSNRPLRQVGKVGNYEFVDATELQPVVDRELSNGYTAAWKAYNNLLAAGVAREVARMVLPIGLYSSIYITLNPRNLMHMLELRTAPNAQWEIRQIADSMEKYFKEAMPLTYDAWKEWTLTHQDTQRQQ
jgi:thymidylate synthase (FAD)